MVCALSHYCPEIESNDLQLIYAGTLGDASYYLSFFQGLLGTEETTEGNFMPHTVQYRNQFPVTEVNESYSSVARPISFTKVLAAHQAYRSIACN